MITVDDVLHCLEAFAPYAFAESWDNCGLLAGDRKREVTQVLCVLDVTEKVVQEAVELGVQVIVAHHPVIFTAIRCVTADDAVGRILRMVVTHDIAVICMHTNADCAWGGVNDLLASALGLSDVINLGAGESGRLGRVGNLPAAMEPMHFARYVKTALKASGVRFANGGKTIRRVAVGGGACGKLMDSALEKRADAFIIGDCSYDLMQKAESLGLTLIDAGHFPTENLMASGFADIVKNAFPAIVVTVSSAHEDCVHFI